MTSRSVCSAPRGGPHLLIQTEPQFLADWSDSIFVLHKEFAEWLENHLGASRLQEHQKTSLDLCGGFGRAMRDVDEAADFHGSPLRGSDNLREAHPFVGRPQKESMEDFFGLNSLARIVLWNKRKTPVGLRRVSKYLAEFRFGESRLFQDPPYEPPTKIPWVHRDAGQ